MCFSILFFGSRNPRCFFSKSHHIDLLNAIGSGKISLGALSEVLKNAGSGSMLWPLICCVFHKGFIVFFLVKMFEHVLKHACIIWLWEWKWLLHSGLLLLYCLHEFYSGNEWKWLFMVLFDMLSDVLMITIYTDILCTVLIHSNSYFLGGKWMSMLIQQLDLRMLNFWTHQTLLCVIKQGWIFFFLTMAGKSSEFLRYFDTSILGNSWWFPNFPIGFRHIGFPESHRFSHRFWSWGHDCVGIPKMAGLYHGKTIHKWMINGGTPHFRRPPHDKSWHSGRRPNSKPFEKRMWVRRCAGLLKVIVIATTMNLRVQPWS